MPFLSEKKFLFLRPSEIVLSGHQPRKHFDEYELKLLADSIAASGILQPLSVRRLPDGRYELIAGERRLRAAIAAGLRRVPCVLHKADDETAALYAITENIQRQDLSFFEEAAALERLIGEYGLPQTEIAARLGIAQSTLSNKLRLLKLSDALQERIASSRLTERHARALLRLPEERREEALDHIIAEGLTLQQTEHYISSLLSPDFTADKSPEPPPEPIRKVAIGDIRLFSNSLSKLLETLQTAGIDARSRRRETEQYIEYEVQIQKNCPVGDACRQLKLC